MLKINSVSLIPNPVECLAELIVEIKILTWESLKGFFRTWGLLKESGETWKLLRNKAVDMDYSCQNWEDAKLKYTWNSFGRYEITWNDLKVNK